MARLPSGLHGRAPAARVRTPAMERPGARANGPALAVRLAPEAVAKPPGGAGPGARPNGRAWPVRLTPEAFAKPPGGVRRAALDPLAALRREPGEVAVSA